MKFLSSIIVVFIIYTNSFYVLALPTNLANALNENVHFNKERTGVSKDASLSAAFNPEYMGGHYQGDMIFPEGALRGAAHRPQTQRWPSGIVPYEILPSIHSTFVSLITNSMRQMEQQTAVDSKPCITFRPRTVNDDIYIVIQNGTGCSAYVGYLPGYDLVRAVTLMHAPPYTCMVTGIIQHELLHVLGFFHEQSRPDRDDYVSILWNNIDAGTESNFDKYSELDIDTLMLPYDYSSVMHYGPYSFSKNGLRTIIPTYNASAVIGQRDGMSPNDILEVQRYYECVPTPTVKK